MQEYHVQAFHPKIILCDSDILFALTSYFEFSKLKRGRVWIIFVFNENLKVRNSWLAKFLGVVTAESVYEEGEKKGVWNASAEQKSW